MSKQVILFDLDGTIIDSYPGISRCVEYALESIGVDLRAAGDLTRFVGPPLQQSFRMFCGLDEPQVAAALEKFRERYLHKGVLEAELYPGIGELLRRLKAEGYTLLLATSKLLASARLILENLGIRDCFDALSGSELDGTRGDKVESILYALELGGVADRSTAIMVGDRKYDVEGAREAGVDCIGVLYGYGSREELLEAGADPALIAQSVADLSRLLRTL